MRPKPNLLCLLRIHFISYNQLLYTIIKKWELYFICGMTASKSLLEFLSSNWTWFARRDYLPQWLARGPEWHILEVEKHWAVGRWELVCVWAQIQWIISSSDTMFSAAILYDSSEGDKKKNEHSVIFVAKLWSTQ